MKKVDVMRITDDVTTFAFSSSRIFYDKNQFGATIPMGKATSRAKSSKRKPRSSKQKARISLWKTIWKWGALAAAWGLVVVIAALIVASFDLPSMDALTKARKPTITIIAADGTELTSYGDPFGEPVPFDILPKHLVNAVVATEDRRFFSHFGLDPLGVARAMVVNLVHGRVKQGGSTITQQLAKVSFLTHERTFKRKVQEALLALQLEANFSKEEILSMYLNRIYLGAGNYGMDAAAQYYFGKHISQVTIYESAMLAGLIKAPSRYAPSVHPKLAAERAAQVLDSMADAGMLSMTSIAKQPYKMPTIVAFDAKKNRIAPYFTDWIMEQLPDYVGSVEQDLVVYTTLDVAKQVLAESAIKERIIREGDSHDMTQGALLSLSNEGAVLAMVGGESYAKSQYNRVTQAMRQPGSAFKPFIFATAFEYGFTPDDIIVDEPIEFSGWSPENYKKEYLGEITLEQAFAKSINTAAIKLAYDVGIRSVIATAKKLGITSEIEPNLSSALGTSEVSLLELTNAYAHFANNAKPVWSHGITEIRTGDLTLYKRAPTQMLEPLLKPSTVAEMNRIFMYTVREGTGKNAAIERDMGGKTGTSQQYRDAWFIGYTPEIITGIWFGNDDNAPMHLVTGGGAPARTWKSYMSAALEGKTVKRLPVTAEAVDRAAENGAESESFWDRIFGGVDLESETPVKERNSFIEYDYPSSAR